MAQKKYLDSVGLSRFLENIKSKFSEKNHTHTKSQITDFPSSMPASDVYSWAKQSSKPSYKVGVNVDSNGNATFSVS